MSVTDVAARIQQIRGQLGLPTVTSTTAASSTSGTAFATALSSSISSTMDGLGSASTGVTGDDVVASAKKYLGVPYVFGSTDPTKGLDCSALVQHAYRDLGIELPRIAKDQAKAGTAVPSLAQAKPGDLLAFNSPVDHISIYLGNNQMIAAPKPGDKVKVQQVYETPVAIRRVLPEAAASTALGGSSLSSPASLPALSTLRPAALSSTVPAQATRSGSALTGVPYADLFEAAAAKHGVPAHLLAAVAKVESGYNPSAVSKAGAQGLMQIMPATAKGLGVNPMDPAQAVDGAARILASNLKQFDSLPLALAAYNAGGGAVRKYGGIPPYAETQAYVPKVQAAMAALTAKGSA